MVGCVRGGWLKCGWVGEEWIGGWGLRRGGQLGEYWECEGWDVL